MSDRLLSRGCGSPTGIRRVHFGNEPLMPLFHHEESGQFVLTSYKVMYSQFASSPNWRTVGHVLTPRLVAHVIRKGGLRRTRLIVRNPYDRVISCFMDKCRAHPMRAHSEEIEWQRCQRLLFPKLGLLPDCDQKEIADRLLTLSFAGFLEILPDVLYDDVHYQPQILTKSVHLAGPFRLTLPFVRVIRMEDSESLRTIPGIDFSKKKHSTGHLQRDFELDEAARAKIRRLYRSDFELGGYPD